jgi:hypothetical protein
MVRVVEYCPKFTGQEQTPIFSYVGSPDYDKDGLILRGEVIEGGVAKATVIYVRYEKGWIDQDYKEIVIRIGEDADRVFTFIKHSGAWWQKGDVAETDTLLSMESGLALDVLLVRLDEHAERPILSGR